MTFAKRIKEEISTVKYPKKDNLEELSALINIGGELSISSKTMVLEFKTKNPTVAKRFLKLLKESWQPKLELITKEDNKFNKKSFIIIRILEGVKEILEYQSIFINEIGVVEDEKKIDSLKKAYLRGAFLASGSVNGPKKPEYHLEIYSSSANEIMKVQRLANSFELNMRISRRREGFICYLKDAESIVFFMQLIGANKTLLEFLDYRIKRDFNNSINRLINIEIANEEKVAKAAKYELECIRLLEKNKVILPDKLKKIAIIRKENPEMSLKELINIYEEKYQEKITKSGLNYRLTKIKELSLEYWIN